MRRPTSHTPTPWEGLASLGEVKVSADRIRTGITYGKYIRLLRRSFGSILYMFPTSVSLMFIESGLLIVDNELWTMITLCTVYLA